jgi:signal transduction histidine kinase
MDLLPRYNKNTNNLKEGEAFIINSNCKGKFGEKCQQYYKTLDRPGIYACPFGFNSFVTDLSIKNNEVYTSIIIDRLSTDAKLRAKQDVRNSFKKEELIRFVGITEQNERRLAVITDEKNEEIGIIISIFHEIRKLSRDLNNFAELFQKITHNQDEIPTALTDNIIQTINMIMIRVNSYELIKNPQVITNARVKTIEVYKKFDKCRFIMNSKSKKRNVSINFVNEAHFTISGYEVFDLIPYILIDNSVKYCPDNHDIAVTFNTEKTEVSVSNLSIPFDKGEIKYLGNNRGFRGKNASNFQGSGLGLNMLKQLCDLHNIKIEYGIGDVIQSPNGEYYSKFEVKLSMS